MKKRFEVIKSMMALCLLIFLSGCNEKNAMPVEEPVSEQKEQISDAMPVKEPIKEKKTQAAGTLSTYGSEEEMYAAQTKRLAQKLVLEGQIKDEHDLIFADACQRNISYSYLYFHDYAYKDESALDICYPYELYYISLSEEGEITYYYTLLDYYVRTLDSGETVIFAGNERDEVIREVTDLSTALKQESPFKYSSPQIDPLKKAFKSGVDLIRVLENQWSTEQLARLQDPVTAAEALLLLRGGNGEYFYSGYKCMVKYQFANGEEITYDMALDGEYWMPMSCWEKDDELYPELKGITEEQKRYDVISTLAAKSITMEDIENVLYYMNSPYSNYYDYYDGMLEVEINAENFGVFRCGNIQLFTDWNNCYPIEDVCVPGEDYYGAQHGKTGCCDCDGDGQKEYALVKKAMGGTGVYMEDLYIFDIENDHLNVRLFN